MNRAAEVRRTAPSVPGYTRWEPQKKNRDRGEQEKVQSNNGCKVSKCNEKCKSAHSEISINSTQDQSREGHSQVQFSKNAEKDRDSLQSSNRKTAYHKEISKRLTATSHQKQQKPERSGILRVERGPQRAEMLIINPNVGLHIEFIFVNAFWPSHKLFSLPVFPQ